MFDPIKRLEKHLGEFDFNSRIPFYNDDSDYNTNAPSYYDDLARKNKLIKHLALRIWDYDKELAKRFEAWDKNLEEFDDEVLRLLKEWMSDGTFDDIINEVLFGKLNDKIDHINDKFKYVSILDFPKLESDPDDTNRIQRALDSMSKCGELQLYNETYTVSKPIRLKSNQRIKGAGIDCTKIFNNAGTEIITTFDNEERYYYINVSDMTIEGDIKNGQTGLHIPHVTHSNFDNLLITNVSIGIYIVAKKSDGTVTGAYYNNFYNMLVNDTEIGIYLDDISNENKFYGGKINLSNTGVKINSNNSSFYGVCLEANHEKHIHFSGGYNNSFYSPRIEGYETSIGIHQDLPEYKKNYSNYIYSPHFQALKELFIDDNDTLFMTWDSGLKVPVRLSQPVISGHRNTPSNQPMVNMIEKSSTGTITYGSKQNSYGSTHMSMTSGDELVAEINGYGEFISLKPNRGIKLTSENGTLYALRVSDTGELLTTVVEY